MNRTIDNFDLIKALMTFGENDNLFMHLQILRRGKDNPGLPAANKLIKAWLVLSPEHLDSLKGEVVFLCDRYGARAYISCVPKSIEKLNRLIMRKLADNQYTGNVINPWHVFNSACGELPGVEKRWVVDIDTKDAFIVDKIKDEIWTLWVAYGNMSHSFTSVPTLNGIHLIVPPFNLCEFSKRFPEVEVKKNGLTVLYVPQCICEKL